MSKRAQSLLVVFPAKPAYLFYFEGEKERKAGPTITLIL